MAIHRPYWESLRENTRKDKPAYPKLKGRHKVEIAILGGGIAGISNAYFMAKAGFDVALLEAHQLGMAGTASSLGILMPGLQRSFAETISRYGEEKALKLWEFSLYSSKLAEDTLKQENLRVEIRRTGALQVASSERHAKMLAGEYQTRASYGIHCNFIEKDEVKSRLGSNLHYAGMHSPYEKTLNPLQFAEELGKAAARNHAAIYEHSLARNINHLHDRFYIRTELGEVEAKKVVIATGAYAHTLGLGRHLIPASSLSVSVSEIPQAMQGVLQRKLASPVIDNSNFYSIARLSPGDGILLSHSDVEIGQHKMNYSKEHSIHDGQKKDLMKELHKLLPDYAHIPIHYAWNSHSAHTVSGLPMIGPHPKNHAMLYATAFGSNGLLFAFLSGKLNADYLENHHKGVFDIFHQHKTYKFIPPRIEHIMLNKYVGYQKVVGKIMR